MMKLNKDIESFRVTYFHSIQSELKKNKTYPLKNFKPMK